MFFVISNTFCIFKNEKYKNVGWIEQRDSACIGVLVCTSNTHKCTCVSCSRVFDNQQQSRMHAHDSSCHFSTGSSGTPFGPATFAHGRCLVVSGGYLDFVSSSSSSFFLWMGNSESADGGGEEYHDGEDAVADEGEGKPADEGEAGEPANDVVEAARGRGRGQGRACGWETSRKPPTCRRAPSPKSCCTPTRAPAKADSQKHEVVGQ